MKLPKSFVYMHHPFKIIEGDVDESNLAENEHKFLWGAVRWAEGSIVVNPNLSPHLRKTVLAHELWHVAIDKCGIALDTEGKETLVDLLSHCMVEMFASNPWFGEYFHDHS